VLARVLKESAAPVQGGAPGLVVVLDEAHMCKGAKTQRTRAAAALCKAALKQGGRAWLLTGTPVQNRPAELRVVLSVAGLFEEAFGSYTAFCTAFGGVMAAQSSAAKAGPAVAEALARVALRRTKDEVARDLPAKSYEDRTVELEGKAAALAEALAATICDRLAAEGVADLDLLPPAEREAAIERALSASSDIGDVSAARRVLALAKLPAAMAEVEACEEAGEPLVVATTCRDAALAIGSRAGWACIVGGVEQEERTRIVAAFQAGDLKGIALTIRAGGTGLTLTRASRFLFVDLDWNPAQNAQAEDRIHRIGQERPCTIVTLVGDCWIERRVLDLCRSKRELSRASLSPLVGRAPASGTPATCPGSPSMTSCRRARRKTPRPS
jgi:SNF2 family DNA or RNA helicase